jgi:hypothetical protein
MTNKPSLASGGGINWNWYLAYEVDGDFITILCETRFHKFDYSQGAEWDDLLAPLARGVHYTMHESDGWERIVQGITVNGLYRPLRVPEPRFTRHAFDWRIFRA